MKSKSTIYRRREPEAISEALGKYVKRMGLAQKINENMAIVIWPKAVGRKIANKAEPYRIRGGVLFVRTASATWAQELSAMKPTLMEKLNKLLADAPIKDIRFRTK